MALKNYGITKKVINLFYLIDMSGSMAEKVDAVNLAMRGVKDTCNEILGKDENLDIDIKIRVIGFSGTKAEYMMNTSKKKGLSPEEFKWVDIKKEACRYQTPTDKAIDLIYECCKDTEWKDNLSIHITAPLFMLISDGFASDRTAYINSIEKLQKSYIGKRATFASIGIDYDKLNADDRAFGEKQLEKFGRNGVIYINSNSDNSFAGKLAAAVERGTVTATQMNKNSNVGDLRGDTPNKKNIFEKGFFEDL